MVFITAMALTGCASRTIKLNAHSTAYDGVLTQSIQFTHAKQTHQWVCYSEIRAQQLTGISCQNDTALPLFSGGLVDGIFVFEYPSRFLLKIKPRHMLAYIKMSLFDELEYDEVGITVVKHTDKPGVTHINDKKRANNIIITNL